MIKIALVFTLSLSFLSVGAQEYTEDDIKLLGFIYHQKTYQPDDPTGDLLLLGIATQYRQLVLKTIIGKSSQLVSERKAKIEELKEKYPAMRPDPELLNLIDESYLTYNPEDFPVSMDGKRPPFTTDGLAGMIKQVITDEYRRNGIAPKLGTVHEWSESTKSALRKRFKVWSRVSKLLVALSRGLTSSYLVTGKEDELLRYVLGRPNESVSLEEMFRASYRINEGDAYLTLLTIENILSRYWNSEKRGQRALTTKLKDITNYNYSTDKFGAWYHLFGIMLYGYAAGSLKATTVGRLESAGSMVMSRFKQDEKQENLINSRGGKVGAKLNEFIRKSEHLKFQEDPSLLEESNYMTLGEDFSKRIDQHQKRNGKK